MAGHLLIRKYYECFNERRFEEASDLFAVAAVVKRPPFGTSHDGGPGWIGYSRRLLDAFPDARLRIEHVEQRGDTICEVELVFTGTLARDLDVPGHGVVKGNGRPVTLRLGEMLEIRGNMITFTRLSFDTAALVRPATREK